MKIKIISILITGTFLFSTCKKDDPSADTEYRVKISCVDTPLIISLDDDKALGKQFDEEISKNTTEYPLLDPAQYATAYTYITKIRDKILNSGRVKHKDDFVWQVKIIKNDSVLNAFCTPGGYIYVYSGIIKYLEKEDDLAGVLGHEIAHADLRHTSHSIQTEQGISIIQEILLGKNYAAVANIAKQLGFLKYSRCHESQADEASVVYLSGTNYKCNGAASFFEKIAAQGGSSTPVFLSTHPDPGKRVESINAKSTKLNCNVTTPAADADYTAFKASLPK